MAEITATMVKALRERTGQGMMECKKALQEAGGDIEAATDLLRKKGLATAEKKAGRATSEGRIAIKLSEDGTSAAMVEVQCETDFCARSDVFIAMVGTLAELALEAQDGQVEASDQMAELVQSALAKIRENMKYVRGRKISAPRLGSYLHHNNKVGVLVGIEGDIDEGTLNDLCMHIAFADPVGITADDVPAELVEKEKELAKAQAIESGKPAEIAEKIVAGKLRKYLASVVLLEQQFVRDDKKKVKDILGGAKVKAFARFAVGQ